MTKYDDAFGDAVYDAWRAGYDPDRVDMDRIHEDVDDGYDRFETADREVSRLRKASHTNTIVEDD